MVYQQFRDNHRVKIEIVDQGSYIVDNCSYMWIMAVIFSGVCSRDAYASENRTGLFLQSRPHFLQEDTAALLAGKGFTTLALAFFGAPGLPRC